ncbi:MAG: hypothetical protein EZS28_008854 [Streblomastix strix]|uniref:Uncharacterized protein n=1 Tax=Streblomastix strix TaxID=222440 RepID=A0A5J4WN07_9EUKA|nr:MAG: hypothetical protein EZS28_008854 [Streblomastix strix]
MMSLFASSVSQISGKLIGNMKIYTRERKKSQYIPAHTGKYVEAVLEGQNEKSRLFCITARSKLLMNEVNPVAARGTALRASW